MQLKRPRSFAQLSLGLAVIAAWSLAPLRSNCAAVEVAVSREIAGKTPELVGYNAGHFMPGSNTSEWWEYSGVNAARIWSPPESIEGRGEDDLSPYGDGVIDRPTFLKRREALCSDPLSPRMINWRFYEDRFAHRTTDGNRMRLDYAFGTLQKLGISATAVIERNPSAFPWRDAGTPDGWADRWEYWQHYYAHAFHLARRFNVQRFHVYNEPDHNSESVPQSEYLERLQFASDAIQAAVRDVNRLYDKSLAADVQAPVTAGASSDFGPKPGGDPRDDLVGWGQLVVRHRHAGLFNETDQQFPLLHSYAYQQYGDTAQAFGHDLATLRKLVSEDSGNEIYRLAITEFNVHTAANFAAIPTSLDAPNTFVSLGAILASLANNHPDELFVFKFSQTANFDGGKLKKNGCHFVDNNDPPYNVGGVTKGGEVVRLFASAFGGGQELLAAPQVTGGATEDFVVAAARNVRQGRYALILAHTGSIATVPVTLDLRAWRIPAGAMVTIEEVSRSKHGEIRANMQVPKSGIVSFKQLAQSVVLVSVADKKPARHVVLSATDDAMVKSGVNADSNYGASKNLRIKNNPVNASARNVSFLKFNLGAIDPASIEQAILQVNGQSVGRDDRVLVHVYGIHDDEWDETAITWKTAPNLADCHTAITEISHNCIQDVGDTAHFVGHLTGTHDAGTLRLDTSRFVRNHPDRQVSFLIARELRFDGDDIDDAQSSLLLASRERADESVPKLTLLLRNTDLPSPKQ